MAPSRSRHPPNEGTTDVDLARVERLVLELVRKDPARRWRGVDIAAALDRDDVLGVFVALAMLANDGRLDNPAPGRYCWPRASQAETAARNHRRIDGD